MKEEMNQFNEQSLRGIQFLRWIAATFVVVAHVDISKYFKDAAAFGTFGFGVDIFFTISGFIMMYLLETRKDRADTFFARRFSRIFPLYFLSTAMVVLLAYLLKLGFIPVDVIYHYPPQKIDIDYFLSSIFFVNNDRAAINAIGWTLQYEMVFYLVLSLVIFLHVNRPIIFCIFIYSISVIISFYGSKLVLMGNALFIEFIFGMIVFKFWKNNSINNKYLIYILPLVILVFLMLWKNQPSHFRWMSGDYWRVLTAGVAGAGLLIFTLKISSIRYVKNWMVAAGSYSYSLYLIHWILMPIICISMAKYFPDNFIAYFITVIGICHVLAYVNYKMLDEPIARFLNKKFFKINN
jgi:peptidoglycan/LPS O-acetylase OafA/YrhL